jgi:hypothetical protein
VPVGWITRIAEIVSAFVERPSILATSGERYAFAFAGVTVSAFVER